MRVVFDTFVELCEEVELFTTESGNSSFVVSHFKQAVYMPVPILLYNNLNTCFQD